MDIFVYHKYTHFPCLLLYLKNKRVTTFFPVQIRRLTAERFAA